MRFESVVILDSGKTKSFPLIEPIPFESVVILDSGKTRSTNTVLPMWFESVVILDSGKTEVPFGEIAARLRVL